MARDTAQAPLANVEAEQALLGAILDVPECLDRIAFLHAEHFYEPVHGDVYTACRQRHARGEHVSPVSIKPALADHPGLTELGGASYIANLYIHAIPAGSVADYARQIVDLHARRELVSAAESAIKRAGGGDTAEDAIAGLDADLDAIRGSTQRRPASVSFSRALTGAMERLVAARDEGPACPTGLAALDRKIGGLFAGDMLLFGGRPSMGKTAVAQSIAQRIARRNRAVIFASLEMQSEDLVIRMASEALRERSYTLPYQSIRSGRVTDGEAEALMLAARNIEALPIHVIESHVRRLTHLQAEIRRLVRKITAEGREVGAVIVDYLGLIDAGSGFSNDNSRISYVSQQLKAIAGENKVPLIVLSQLNRAVEQREDKRPQLADLRDSGCLAGDTTIYNPSSGEWRRIDSMVGETPRVSVAAGSSIVDSPASAVFCSGRKPVFTLRTGSGRSIRATACHRFLTPRGWARLDGLAAGDQIATAAQLNGPTDDTMTWAEAALLGRLIGDGCVLPRHSVQYTTPDLDLAESAAALATEVFGPLIAPRIAHEGRKGSAPTWFQVFLASAHGCARGQRNPVVDWFGSLGIMGLRSPEKRIPDHLFRQSNCIIAAFLSHLWTTDGSVVVRKRASRGRGVHPTRKPPRDLLAMTYSTASEALADGVYRLLLRLGIRARIAPSLQKTGRYQYSVVVLGLTGKRRFAEFIRCVGGRKAPLFERARELLAECSECKTYDGDIYWDAVKSIESDGAVDVYDITVPALHNFIANSFVVHNSLEQDADAVIFAYRPEYYLERVEPDPSNEGKWADWREKMDKARGRMELIVAKQRMGPIGAVTLLCDLRTNSIWDAEQ